MINNNKTNDWFTSILFNLDKSIPDLIASGLNGNNTGLESREFYKNKPKVQEIFSDENNKFNEVAFNLFYDSSLRTYNSFLQIQIEDSFLDDQIFAREDSLIDKDVVRRQNRFDLIKITNPLNLTYGTTSLFGLSESKLSAREIAQNNKVRDPFNNRWLDYTPNDAGGTGFSKVINRLNKAVFGPTLALASFDEDGEHELEDGRIVLHSKGDLKVDENGTFYYELLGNRSPYGKTLLHVTDVLTIDGSVANKFDFFDSDSKEKSVIGSTMKMVTTLAPFLIKGIKTPYAYITAALSFGSAMAGIFKTFEESRASKQSTAWKYLNTFEGFLKKFDTSVSDDALSRMMGYENFTNMLSDIVLQLYQQRSVAELVGKTPSWLGLTAKELNLSKTAMAKYNPSYVKKYGKSIQQAIKDADLASEYKLILEIAKASERYSRLKSLEKTGGNMSKMYMAITQTGDIVETMDEAGFSQLGKLVGTGAALFGFKYIFDSELGDVALKHFGYDDIGAVTKRFLMENAKSIEKEVATKLGLSGLNNAAKVGLFRKFGNKLSRAYRWAMDHPNDYISASLREAAEELSEEALLDVILNSLSAIESVFRTDGQNTYSFLESNPLERYFMSAMGGALGGPIFVGVDKMERGVFNVHRSMNKDNRQDMLNHIRHGESKQIITHIDKLMKKNKLGLSTLLSTKLADNLTDDGKYYFLPAERQSDSQAWALGETIKGWVKSVDSVINNEGFVMSDEDLIFKAVAKDSRLANLINQGVDLGIINDFKFNLGNLVDARLAQKDKQEEDLNLKNNYETARRNLDDLLSGNRAEYYVKKLAFLLTPQINSTFTDANIEMYAYARGIDYNNLSEDNKLKLRTEYDKAKGSTDENEMHRWDEMAFNAYQAMEGVIGKNLIQFGDNYALNLETGDLIKDTNFTNYVKSLQEVFPSTNEELTQEEKMDILNDFRDGKSNEEIIRLMNPTNAKLSDKGKQKLIEEYLTSNIVAMERLENLRAAKWAVKTFKQQELNPESLKYGLDSMVMLKTRELLRETLNNIKAIMEKYNINYIDSRTNDSLVKMERALNNINIKRLFNSWTTIKDSDSGLNNITKLLLENGIENFLFILKGDENGDSYEIEGINIDYSQDITWTLQKLYDTNGVPILSTDGTFAAISEKGGGTDAGNLGLFSVEQISEMVFDKYLSNINSILDFVKLGLNSVSKIDEALNNNSKQAIGDYILSDMFNALGEDFTQRLEIIQEAERLRTNVLRNPIYNALKTISEQILGKGEDVFSMIEREELELGNRSRLEDYVLSDLVKSDRLETSFMLLQTVKNIINSKIKDSSTFDFNDIINNYLLNFKNLSDFEVNKNNPTITPEIASIITSDINSISEKIKYLVNLNLINNASKFLDSAKALVKLNSLMIEALTGKLGNKFSFVQNAKLNGELFFDLSEVDVDPDDMIKIGEYTSKQSGISNDDAVTLTENILTKIKIYLYNRFNSADISDDIRQNMIIQMMDNMDFSVTEQRLNLNLDPDSLNLFTVFSSLIATLSNDPVKFRTLFVEKLGDLVPYSMLLFNSEIMCAYAENNKWFSEVIKEVKSNLDKYYPGKKVIAEKNASFTNILYSWGNAGSGKTVFLANMVAKLYSENNKDKTIWLSGPNLDRANNLSIATGIETNFDKTELFRQILTQDGFKRYEKMMNFVSENESRETTEINGRAENLISYHVNHPIKIKIDESEVTLASSLNLLSPEYITSEHIKTTPDLLLIDEITKFNIYELTILDRAGIKVIGVGDRSQISAKLFNNSFGPSGIYFNTPELAMSVRSTNIHKKDNDTKLNNLINELLDIYSADNTVDLSETFNKAKDLTTFTYNEIESEGTSILNGEKIVLSLTVFGEGKTIEGLVKGLEENEKIVYIHNPGGKSTYYNDINDLHKKYPGKIVLETLDSVQGKEYKYAIVDIDFSTITDKRTIFKNDKLIKSLREYKTAVTRSMDGTIVVDNKTSPFNKEHSEFRGYTKPIGDSTSEQAKEYSKRVKEIIVSTTPNIKIDNERSSESQEVEKESKVEVEETMDKRISTPEFIKNNAHLGTFYNHLSINPENFKSSNLREDLGIFGDLKNKTQFVKLRKGLNYLRSYIITSKIAKNKSIDPSIFLSKSNASNFSEFSEILSGGLAAELYRLLNAGEFLIKITNTNNDYAKSYQSIDKNTENLGSNLLGRIVYQIKDLLNVPYDITVGAVSSDFVSHLMKNGKIGNDKIATPTGKSEIYFKFNTDPLFITNNMIPLTRKDGYQVDDKLKLSDFKKQHPEMLMSNVLLANSGDHKGKPFIIYSYNLFGESDTKDLVRLRDNEINNNVSIKTTSVMYLDRVGYNISEWMDLFGKWISEGERRKHLGYFTGYMTATRFVASMIDYYNKLPEGNSKNLIKSFLAGRVEPKMMSSNVIGLSKTKENVDNLTKWLQNDQNTKLLNDWLEVGKQSDESTFDEEQFIKSSKFVADKLKGKSVKNMIITLSQMHEELSKNPSEDRKLTPEAILEFKDAIERLEKDFEHSDELNRSNANKSGIGYASTLVYELLSNGVLVKSTKMNGILYDLHALWTTGSDSETATLKNRNDKSEAIVFPKDEFRDLFTEIIDRSPFFNNGMIFREGKAFKEFEPNKGKIEGAYYEDCNPVENFTTNSNILLPSIYFNKVNTVDLNAVKGEQHSAEVKNSSEIKSTQELNISELRNNLLSLLSNLNWSNGIETILNMENVTVDDIPGLVKELILTYGWSQEIYKINGINQIIIEPTISVKDNQLLVEINYRPLGEVYVSNEYDLNTVNITKNINELEFIFSIENGNLYRFSGNPDGSFVITLEESVEISENIEKAISEFVREAGNIYEMPGLFDEMAKILINRYSNLALYSEDMKNGNLLELYRGLIPASMDPNMIDIITTSLEDRFKKLNCK